MTECNGWTNYATWRVHLELFDGQSPYDITGQRRPHKYDLQQALRDQATEALESSATAGQSLALDFALAFLSDVNWWEIATNLLDAYADEDEDEDEDTEESETQHV